MMTVPVPPVAREHALVQCVRETTPVDIPLRDSGGDGPVVLFLHGLLVDGSLWDAVVERLPGHRCLVPELPLGSHTTPFADRSRLTMEGVADLAADVLDELGVDDVTVVGNDTGGALAQLLVTRRPARIGRLILTPCDAFEVFPPPLFKLLFALGRTAFGLNAGIQPLRTRFGRRLPIAYGKLSKRASDEQLERWIAPALSSRRVRADVAHLLRHASPAITLDAAAKLTAFDKPATVAWPPDDPAFPFSLARRLVRVLPRAELVEVADSRAFVPVDAPDALARLIQSPQASS
jgi:pimeloyl-ACP methyl ester carboxylesterase